MSFCVFKKYILFISLVSILISFDNSFGLSSNCTNYISTIDGKILSPIVEMPSRNNLTPFRINYENNGMTKERFIALIDKTTEIFQPFFIKLNAKLKVNKRWDDDSEQIHADQLANGDWRVTMTGGFARNSLITEDGFLMALCHEIGQHLGGAPRYKNNTDWASTEGQADYFASLKCFRRIIEKDDNISIISKLTIPSEVINSCKSIYKTPQDIAICQRSAMAGFSLANLIASRSETPIIKFNTPDQTKVSKTIEDGPLPQCRLDTFYQGTLCDVSVDEELSNDNPRIGTCSAKDGFNYGYRPFCWYNPSNEK